MANFLAMALVRDVHLAAARGLAAPPRGAALEGARVYTSDQTHFSIARALDELGFPPETLVVLPTDDRFRLHPEPVAEAIARDRAAGLTPIAISAVAGSTNTGSVDLIERARGRRRTRGPLVPRRRGVRGGGPALGPRRVPRSRPRAGRLGHRRSPQVVLPGLRHRRPRGPRRLPAPADVRREAARVLPRRRTDGGRRRDARRPRRPRRPGQLNFYKLGFEGTRRWRALKLWMSWKHVGTSGFGRLVAANIDPAALLARAAPRATTSRRCRRSRSSRSCASAICRRAAARRRPRLDDHQDALQAALEADGDGWLSTTRLRGSTWLRAGIVNTAHDPGRHRPADLRTLRPPRSARPCRLRRRASLVERRSAAS